MGITNNLGRLSAGLTADASLNIGVGVTPSGTYKFEVGTTSKFTGVATFGSTLSNGTYTYTLPSATGTLALTSALSGYLPLTGGTLTGALGGTSATFSGNVLVGGTSYSVPSGYTGIGINNATNGGLLDLLLNDVKKGELYITSTSFNMYGFAGVGLNLTVDNSSKGLAIASTGAATFSSSITAGGKIFTSASVNDNIIEVINSDITNGYGLYVRGGGTASNRYVARFKNGADSDVMWVGTSNVGIGTTSPGYKFTVGIDTETSTMQTYTNGTSGASQGAVIRSWTYVTENYARYTDIVSIGNWDGSNGKSVMRFFTQDASTSPTERMRITSGGNVVIGGTSFSGVSSGSTGLEVKGINAQLLINNQNYNWLTVYSATDSNIYNIFGPSGNYLIGTGNRDTSSFSEKMRITSGGTSTVLLGSTTSIWQDPNRGTLEINGVGTSLLGFRVTSDATSTAYIYDNATNIFFQNNKAGGAIYIQSGNSGGVQLLAGSTAFAPQSDERLKNIQGNIENALDSLMTLRTVIYSWKSDETNKENLGLIAQDVEKVFPQVVEKSIEKDDPINGITDTIEYLSLKYTDLIPVLVAAIQELSKLVQEQQQQIKELQSQINK